MVVQDVDWSTHVYIKPYSKDSEGNRFDFGNFNVLKESTALVLLGRLEKIFRDVDVVIINEQVSTGIHNSHFFRDHLQQLLHSFSDRIFLLDSRHYSDKYEGTIRKINAYEAVRLCGIDRKEGEIVMREEVLKAMELLYSRWQKPLFVSRGARGCMVRDILQTWEIPGLQILGKVDPVGAGDSMLAGLAAALAVGKNYKIAAAFGNFVAGVTVQKIFQTGTSSPEEIVQIGSDPDYIYRPELADDQRHAQYISDTDIEVVSALPASICFTHAIFDHDGTISTLRQGWEKIMEPMMVKSILGDCFSKADEALYHKVVSRVRNYIDKTTGIQTISQMEGLVEMIKDFGCVPEEKILDAYGYKEIYNRELKLLVADRIKRLQKGELSAEDFMIKNVFLFLKALFDKQIKLYLASGTDKMDVSHEAESLGYANFFGDRIYGAEHGAKVEAKKMVIEKILNDIRKENIQRLITFGDGPVEMRLTHKVGGYTVGVASEEIRRFGLNIEKRSRLIRAGADLIIPDYSQKQQLLNSLGLS
jgi:phosphoglycolate phosphatase-like HAD superfamily hydrolase